jgi:hypothetical protein
MGENQKYQSGHPDLHQQLALNLWQGEFIALATLKLTPFFPRDPKCWDHEIAI